MRSHSPQFRPAPLFRVLSRASVGLPLLSRSTVPPASISPAPHSSSAPVRPPRLRSVHPRCPPALVGVRFSTHLWRGHADCQPFPFLGVAEKSHLKAPPPSRAPSQSPRLRSVHPRCPPALVGVRFSTHLWCDISEYQRVTVIGVNYSWKDWVIRFICHNLPMKREVGFDT